jgi:hypothetical protein
MPSCKRRAAPQIGASRGFGDGRESSLLAAWQSPQSLTLACVLLKLLRGSCVGRFYLVCDLERHKGLGAVTVEQRDVSRHAHASSVD